MTGCDRSPMPQPKQAANRLRLRTRFRSRRALSLLEIVLALSILAVASAYLAQSMHIAAENAMRAETQTQAEIVAESVMNQVIAGFLSTQSVSWVNYSPPNPLGTVAVDDSGSQWLYMITMLSTEVQGMMCVQVAVKEILPGQTDSNYAFTINRWIIDPSLGLDTPPTDDASASSSSTSGGGTSAASGSAGASGGGSR